MPFHSIVIMMMMMMMMMMSVEFWNSGRNTVMLLGVRFCNLHVESEWAQMCLNELKSSSSPPRLSMKSKLSLASIFAHPRQLIRETLIISELERPPRC
jgi:hypothetical protein